MEMPKFNFSKMSFQSDEELESAEKDNNKGGDSKFFRPGQYDVTIGEVLVKGPCAKDPTWVGLELTYKGTGEKTIRGYVQVPTEDVKYGANGTMLPYRTLRSFCGAMGQTLSVPTIKDVVRSLFAKPEKLVGRPLTIQVAYQKAYAKFAGKRDDGSTYYQLIGRDGQALHDVDGVALEFPDRSAVENYATGNKIPYDKFPSVVAYNKSTALGNAPLDIGF